MTRWPGILVGSSSPPSGLRFDRLFCGQGWSHDLDSASFHRHLLDLVERMGRQ